MKELKRFFEPNARISRKSMILLTLFQMVAVLVLWQFFAADIIPKPTDILKSLGWLITDRNMLGELGSTTILTLKAMFFATTIGMVLSFLAPVAFFKPTVGLVSNLRFLTLVGFSVLIRLYTSTGEEYKVVLLIFGMLPYIVTAMSVEVIRIKKEKYNYARTLGYGPWGSLWNVGVRGLMPKVLEVVRQNFAIAWMMITMVESANRENGGIGALLYDQNRFAHNFDPVFAIQLAIFIVGMSVHVLLNYVNTKTFKWAYISKS